MALKTAVLSAQFVRPNEEFSTYVNGLQSEIMESCARRPVLADADFFKGKVLKAEVKVVEGGKEVVRTEKHVITETEAKAINKWLYKTISI